MSKKEVKGKKGGEKDEEKQVKKQTKKEEPEDEGEKAPPEPNPINDALRVVLRKSLVRDGLARGIRECLRAIERGEAKLCVLAEDCDEKNYKSLITALCKERGVLLCPVDSYLLLGEWAELCKRDKSGVPRKIVKCSCVVVKDFAETSDELDLLLNHLKGQTDNQ